MATALLTNAASAMMTHKSKTSFGISIEWIRARADLVPRPCRSGRPFCTRADQKRVVWL